MDDDDSAAEVVFMAAVATAVNNLQSMSHTLGTSLARGQAGVLWTRREAFAGTIRIVTMTIQVKQRGLASRARELTTSPLPGECA